MHSPCDHFARLGHEYLINHLPESVTDTQPSDDAEDGRPGTIDHWRESAVLTMLRGNAAPAKKKGPKPKQLTAEESAEPLKEKPLTFAGVRIYWPNCLPRLAVWRGGRMTLDSIIAARVAALWEMGDLPFGTALIDWQGPCNPTSGLDPRSVANALDTGFAPNALGMTIIGYPAAELLAIIGMEVTPIARVGYPPAYSYADHHGSRWTFGAESRDGNYAAITYARPVAEATPTTIRERVIARAKELGLTAYAIARDTNGIVSPDHVKRYITDEADMTGERLDAVMRVVGLQVTRGGS